MDSVLKFDKVILVKELNEKFQKIGELFEVAIIRDNSFLLREASSKVAVGVINFDDFERCFVKEEEFKGWTNWTPLVGADGRTDVFYRTNRKRVQVRFLTDKVRAESSCNPVNEFNLYFGIQMAYTRCENKVLLKHKEDYERKLKIINEDITYNNDIIKKMIGSLGV